LTVSYISVCPVSLCLALALALALARALSFLSLSASLPPTPLPPFLRLSRHLSQEKETPRAKGIETQTVAGKPSRLQTARILSAREKIPGVLSKYKEANESLRRRGGEEEAEEEGEEEGYTCKI